MQLNDDVYVLVLPLEREGQPFPLNLTLLLDAEHGSTLIDTGVPGQLGAIGAGLALAGIGLKDLRWIVLTHQDIDHVGSLHDLVHESGARVLAHEDEAPFIDGRQPARFARPEVLANRPEMRAVVERLQPTPVDQPLRDGDHLEVAGGVLAIATPGHTVGHMSLYLERSRTLVAGDALTASSGRLLGPMPAATQDMRAASASVRKLAELEVEAIVCYHGGVVDDDASEQLRRVAGELGS